jgi:hypothetical protein
MDKILTEKSTGVTSENYWIGTRKITRRSRSGEEVDDNAKMIAKLKLGESVKFSKKNLPESKI